MDIHWDRSIENIFDPNDPVIFKLVAEGAVTVLSALLPNEEGALQNYACEILANLLCWDARQMPQFRAHTSKQQDLQKLSSSCGSPKSKVSSLLRSLDVLFLMNVHSVQQLVPLAEQVTNPIVLYEYQFY